MVPANTRELIIGSNVAASLWSMISKAGKWLVSTNSWLLVVPHGAIKWILISVISHLTFYTYLWLMYKEGLIDLYNYTGTTKNCSNFVVQISLGHWYISAAEQMSISASSAASVTGDSFAHSCTISNHFCRVSFDLSKNCQFEYFFYCLHH